MRTTDQVAHLVHSQHEVASGYVELHIPGQPADCREPASGRDRTGSAALSSICMVVGYSGRRTSLRGWAPPKRSVEEPASGHSLDLGQRIAAVGLGREVLGSFEGHMETCRLSLLRSGRFGGTLVDADEAPSPVVCPS